MQPQKRVIALVAAVAVVTTSLALVVIRRHAGESSSRIVAGANESTAGSDVARAGDAGAAAEDRNANTSRAGNGDPTSSSDPQASPTRNAASSAGNAAVASATPTAAAALPLSAAEARTRVREARRLLEQGRAAAAESLLLQVTAAAPQSAGAWNVMGRTQLALGRVDAAEQSFARACEVDSTHPWARNNLAWLHLQHGEWQAALPLLETAVRLDCDVAVFHNNLGVAYERARRFDDAAREYARALELQPEHATAGDALARVRDAVRAPLAAAGVPAADSVLSATSRRP